MGQKYKTAVGILYQTPFALGEIVLGATVVGVRNWRLLHIILGAPIFLLLGLYFILPESPRWLLANKRYEEAKKVVENGAKMNGVQSSFFLSLRGSSMMFFLG